MRFSGQLERIENKIENVGRNVHPAPQIIRYVGLATWYSKGYNKDGSRFSGKYLTCAVGEEFQELRGKKLKIINLANNKSVVVKVNDKVKERSVIVDLSLRAFSEIADKKVGRIKVSVEELK